MRGLRAAPHSENLESDYQTLLPQTLLPAIIRATSSAMFVKYSILNPFLQTPQNSFRLI